MDPIGFALENFDLVGTMARRPTAAHRSTPPASWSTARRSTARPACARRCSTARDAVRATATEKLLTYALGRAVEYYDMPAVRHIVRDAATERLPLLVARRRHRQERAVPDEEAERRRPIADRAAEP